MELGSLIPCLLVSEACDHVDGVHRSEIKEEMKPGDIRGGRYPAFLASAPTSHTRFIGRGSRHARGSH